MILNKFKSPKATVIGMILRNIRGKEKILLTKRNCEPYKGKWCLPGGHIDPDEKAKEAVIREVKEETGLDFLAEFLMYFDEIIPEKDIHAVVLIFKGYSEGKLNPDEGEVSEARWVTIEEALRFELAFQHREIFELLMKR